MKRSETLSSVEISYIWKFKVRLLAEILRDARNSEIVEPTVAIVVVAKCRALMYFVKEGASLMSWPSTMSRQVPF